MYTYDVEQLKSVLLQIIRDNVPAEAYSWLNERASSANSKQFNITFVTIPRKTGKAKIHIAVDRLNSIKSIRKKLIINEWNADRLARVWMLLNLDASDREKYFTTIENLFLAAEVNELVALYSALPFLAYPDMWKDRCAEGIRSNIADVLTTIMCNNPYPSENLGEAAWNQMVLKAFFTDKPVQEIIGLDERANEQLALTLSDYAHERWAAHRPVNPQLWRCVGPFLNERTFADIQKILGSEDQAERNAAALAIYNSSYAPAKNLLAEEYTSVIKNGTLSWENFMNKPNDYVLQ